MKCGNASKKARMKMVNKKRVSLRTTPNLIELHKYLRLSRDSVYEFGIIFLATLPPEVREWALAVGPKEAALLFEQYRNEANYGR